MNEVDNDFTGLLSSHVQRFLQSAFDAIKVHLPADKQTDTEIWNGLTEPIQQFASGVTTLVNTSLNPWQDLKKPKEIADVEKAFSKTVFWDEKYLAPGAVVYWIEKYEWEGPYPKFRPVKTVLVSKHSSGVDEGYSYEIYKPAEDNKPNFGEYAPKIRYEIEFIWSPLTLTQARVLCKNLNNQMKMAYQAMMKKRLLEKQP